MSVDNKKVKKVLSKKIFQLNDIVADINSLLTEMETEFYRVSIFGSARIGETSEIYRQCHDLAYQLGKLGVDIVTGGGPGIMEAGNKGSQKAANTLTRSIGLSIQLPFEADSNIHLDIKHDHKTFSSRLDEFMRISHAVVVMAGGIGTLLEFFYTWQLIQVGHIKPRPIILLGDMWPGLLEWTEKEPLAKGLMSESDMSNITVAQSVDEVIEHLKPQIDAFKKLHVAVPAK